MITNACLIIFFHRIFCNRGNTLYFVLCAWHLVYRRIALHLKLAACTVLSEHLFVLIFIRQQKKLYLEHKMTPSFYLPIFLVSRRNKFLVESTLGMGETCRAQKHGNSLTTPETCGRLWNEWHPKDGNTFTFSVSFNNVSTTTK